MTQDPSDRELDFLLAEGRLPGPEKERIKERLLASARAARAPARTWFGGVRLAWAALAGAAAVGILALVALPSRRGEEFSVKGAGGGGGAGLALECLGATPAGCPRGAMLMFVVSGAAQPGFLAAYAEPEGGGERIWYFSAEDGAPAVQAHATVPLRHGIRLGDEHRPGRYRVRVVLGGAAALTRTALLGGQADGVLAESTFPLTVVSP